MMKIILFLTVIATVVLIACDNKPNTKEEEEYTITFGHDNYTGISNLETIFTTAEANSDFIIEKAEEVGKDKFTLATNNGLEIKTDIFSAKKIEGHNRLQINISDNTKEEERNFSLYVKNGNERGKLSFIQKAYDPKLIGGEGSILFDPDFYSINAKGGVFEIAPKTTDESFFIDFIQIIGGEKYEDPSYKDTHFLEADYFSATIIDLKDENNSEKTESKIKLDIKPNTTGKNREAYVFVNSYGEMRGYVIVFQSAK